MSKKQDELTAKVDKLIEKVEKLQKNVDFIVRAVDLQCQDEKIRDMFNKMFGKESE